LEYFNIYDPKKKKLNMQTVWRAIAILELNEAAFRSGGGARRFPVRSELASKSR
jgi:hypothetical protein